MPCRIAPAASSTSCLGISDDVLSEAFIRFLRVSDAQRYHAKRFWSNAPGPLEAQRKSTRRRLGLEAVASEQGPPPFDMGALFGLGVKPGVEMEKGMKWERPQMPGAKIGSDTFWTRARQRSATQIHEQEERLTRFLEVPEDPVESCRAGFEARLVAVPDAQTVHSTDIEPLLTYLESDQNEPEARLTERLLAWLCERPASKRCLQSVVSIIKQKLTLKTMLEAEAEDVLRLLRKHKVANKHFVAVATSLPSDWAHRILLGITRDILDSTADAVRLDQLQEWLTCLRYCSHLSGFGRPTQMGWGDVYTEVSKVYLPSDLAKHFSKLRRRDAAMVLLHHWVPRLAHNTTNNVPSVTDAQVKRRLRYNQASVGEVGVPVLVTGLERLHEKHRLINGKSWLRHPLLDLLQVLAVHRVPYQPILAEIVSVYNQTEPASKLRNLVKDMIKHPLIDVAPAIATSVIQSFVDSHDLDYALQIFETVPSVPLSDFYDLPLQLIESRKMHGEKTFMMLSRLTVDDTVPPDERAVHHTMPLTQGHIDVIHLVAYAYANSPHITSRAALRRVWECYRFLKDRQAPLDTLISRALVKAGISRPLAEAKRPSAMQTAYVLDIVREVEGEDLARKLDELVFKVGSRIARGDLDIITPRYKMVQVVREGFERGLVRDAQIRLRSWRSKGWTTNRIRSEARKGDKVRTQRTHGRVFGFTSPGATNPSENALSLSQRVHATHQNVASMISNSPLEMQHYECLEGELRPLEPHASTRKPLPEDDIQYYRPGQVQAPTQLFPKDEQPGGARPRPDVVERTDRSESSDGCVYSSAQQNALQEPDPAHSASTEDIGRDFCEQRTDAKGALEAKESAPSQDPQSEAGVDEAGNGHDVCGASLRPADSYARILGGTDALQLTPFRACDFFRKNHIKLAEMGYEQQAANIDADEGAVDHFDSEAWTLAAKLKGEGERSITYTPDDVVHGLSGAAKTLSAIIDSDATPPAPMTQPTRLRDQQAAHEQRKPVWRAKTPRTIHSARDRALQRWKRKQKRNPVAATEARTAPPEQWSIRYEANEEEPPEDYRMPDYQHHLKFLKRTSLIRAERKALARNADGWKAFSEKLRMRRRQAGYDSWTKGKNGKGKAE